MNALADSERNRFDAEPTEDVAEELRPGTHLLQRQYVIERYLKSGGFGLTYLARDSLDRIVVIKECFPTSLCRRSKRLVQARSRAHQDEFRSVVRLFGQEARRLAKVSHPNIVGVHQVFEDNDTAYMALDYVEGDDLLDMIEAGPGRLSPPEIEMILHKLLHAIGYVHEHGLLHRDISPDNILLDGNGEPVLIDFGAAREQASKASRVLSSLQVVKDGYSPQEFYIANMPQGPAGDLYSLGATFYHLITGEAPANSQLRLAAAAARDPDPLTPLEGRVPGFSPRFLAAIDWAMKLFPRDRPQTAQDWLDRLGRPAPEPVRSRPAAAARSAGTLQPAGGEEVKIRVSLSRLVAETNEAVSEARAREARRRAEEAEKPKVEKKVRKFVFPWQAEEDCLFYKSDPEPAPPEAPADPEFDAVANPVDGGAVDDPAGPTDDPANSNAETAAPEVREAEQAPALRRPVAGRGRPGNVFSAVRNAAAALNDPRVTE